MAFAVITRLELGEGFAPAGLDAKAIIDTLDLMVGVQLLSNLLNNLRMGTELCVEGDHAKMIGLAAKLYSHYVYWQVPVEKY